VTRQKHPERQFQKTAALPSGVRPPLGAIRIIRLVIRSIRVNAFVLDASPGCLTERRLRQTVT